MTHLQLAELAVIGGPLLYGVMWWLEGWIKRHEALINDEDED